MQTFKNLILPYLLLIFSIAGCVASLETQPSPTDVETATSGVVLSLTTPKAAYAATDTIPLELRIQDGKFDLLIPFVNVSTSGAFTQLSVTNSNGAIVEPERSVTVPGSEEIFIEKDGKSVWSRGGKKAGDYTVNRKGKMPKEIVKNAFGMLAWAPNGKELLYKRTVRGQRPLFKTDLDSRLKTPLAPLGPSTRRGRNTGWDWFAPKFLPVFPKPQLLTTVWGKMKKQN